MALLLLIILKMKHVELIIALLGEKYRTAISCRTFHQYPVVTYRTMYLINCLIGGWPSNFTCNSCFRLLEPAVTVLALSSYRLDMAEAKLCKLSMSSENLSILVESVVYLSM